MNLASRVLAAFAAMLMMSACGEPSSSERFIISDGTGEYEFPVEFSDTAAIYDLSFYTAIDKPLKRVDQPGSFPMELLWQAPSGRCFTETVHYPVASAKVLYRKDVEPGELGNWTLRVSVASEPRGLRGLGLEVVRKPNPNIQ